MTPDELVPAAGYVLWGCLRRSTGSGFFGMASVYAMRKTGANLV